MNPSGGIGRDLALLLGATLVSTLGSGMVPVALSFALFAQGAGAGGVSAVLAAEAVPMALLMLAGGVLADRFAPRRMMVLADLLRCLAQAGLAALLLSGPAPLPLVMALAALLGTGTALEAPGRNRLIAQVVPEAGRARANGLLMMGSAIGTMVAPAMGGLLVAGAGPGWAIALDSASYAASAALLAALRVGAEPADASEPGMLAALLQGWSEFVRHAWLWRMVCLFALLHLLSWAPLTILGPLGFSQRAHGARDWGVLLSLLSAGALAGGWLATRLRPRLPIRAVLLWLILLYPPLPICLALPTPYWVKAACFLLGGLEVASVNVLWESTLQRAIPADRLSRVSAYDMLGSFCLMPIGYALAGPLAAWLGAAGTLWLGAGAVVLASLLLLARRDVRQGAALAEPTG